MTDMRQPALDMFFTQEALKLFPHSKVINKQVRNPFLRELQFTGGRVRLLWKISIALSASCLVVYVKKQHPAERQ
jgi:hypothetical protein